MSDEELVQKVQKGDKEVFGELMDRYSDKLTRYGQRFLSRPEHIEDMVQDVFIKAYQNIQSFDSTRKFSSWIYRIAHNTFVNALRQNTREPLPHFDFDTLLAHHVAPDPEEEMKEAEHWRVLIERSLGTLAPIYREVVTLYYFEHLDYQEISDILEIPLGTVGIRLSRAKAQLRKSLTPHREEMP